MTAEKTTPADGPRQAERPGTGASRMGRALAAAALTSLLLPVLLGAIDAVYAITHAAEVEVGAVGLGLASFFSAGLFVPLVLPAAFAAGLVFAVSPWRIGPAGVLAAVSSLARARGDDAVKLSSAIWGVGLTLLLFFYGLFKLNHFFITAFNHPTLAALTLAVVVLFFVALMAVFGLFVVRALRGGLTRLPAPVSAPIVPVALGGVAALVVAFIIPELYAETWDALDLRAPAMALVTGVGLWSFVGMFNSNLDRFSKRALAAAVPLGVILALGGLLLPTLSAFGQSEDDAPLVYAVRERGLLARIPMALLQKRFDSDGDGYAARLGGGDCDDTDPEVYPGADETIGNGRDEDCDGRDLVLKEPPVKVDEGSADAAAEGGEKGVALAAQDKVAGLRRGYNLVFVLVDTLRWDALGYAGYKRPTSPNIDKLAARSVVFDNAYSVSSKTPTAMAPILSSRYPSEMPRSYNHFNIFTPENLFLAEVLKEEGYNTSASGCHWYFQRKYGYDQGFDRWQTYMVKGDEMERIPTSRQATDTAIRMVEALAAGGLPSDPELPAVPPAEGAEASPYFLFVHYLDPHKHYIDHKGFEPFGRSGRDRYDGEIRFTDHHFGRLMETLEAGDPGLKNTVIIMTSDHGEAFGEHDHRFHGRDLYEHQIRVPLLMYVPGVSPSRVKARVSLIDLAPTFLDLVGASKPASFRGESWLPNIVAGRDWGQRPIYTEMPPGPYNGVFRSLTLGDWKLIHRLHGNYHRLFNVSDDPGELKDLWKSRPEKAKEMREALQLFRATRLEPVDAKK